MVHQSSVTRSSIISHMGHHSSLISHTVISHSVISHQSSVPSMAPHACAACPPWLAGGVSTYRTVHAGAQGNKAAKWYRKQEGSRRRVRVVQVSRRRVRVVQVSRRRVRVVQVSRRRVRVVQGSRHRVRVVQGSRLRVRGPRRSEVGWGGVGWGGVGWGGVGWGGVGHGGRLGGAGKGVCLYIVLGW